MSQFHLQLLTFILEIREVKIKYSVLEIQIAEILETLQSTQIFLGRSDRSFLIHHHYYHSTERSNRFV
jgi:hypothetical protein